MAALCRLKASSLSCKPPLKLGAGHLVNIYVHWAAGKGARVLDATASHWLGRGCFALSLMSEEDARLQPRRLARPRHKGRVGRAALRGIMH